MQGGKTIFQDLRKGKIKTKQRFLLYVSTLNVRNASIVDNIQKDLIHRKIKIRKEILKQQQDIKRKSSPRHWKI